MESEVAENTTTKKTKPSGNPPAKPGSSDNQNSNGSDTGATDGATNNGTDESTAPEQNEGEMMEPPCDENDEDCEMPEIPSDMQGGPGGDGFHGHMAEASSDSVLNPVAYLSLGGGSVVLSLIIMYTCFSNFYRKKPGQTFDKAAKFIWYCVATLVLAAGLMALCYFVPIWVK